MTYEEAVAKKEQLNREVDNYSARLQTFEKTAMGLTPDHVRETKEWKEADAGFKKAFKELQEFNKWYVKEFRRKKGKR